VTDDGFPIRKVGGSTAPEVERKVALARALRESRVPDDELLDNLGVYLTRQSLSRILFMHRIYLEILPVHGVIMEFGVRWGQNCSLFTNFRGMYEPYNYNRKVVGFDTFQGFPATSKNDGDSVAVGDYSVARNWADDLEVVLELHNGNSPIPHLRKYELVRGDAAHSLPLYLEAHPETIVALAFFDFDLYEPTRVCLESILPHLTKGSVLAFDELNCSAFPGETIALNEVMGLSRYAIRRDPNSPLSAWLVIE
jgi:hypothetical protein